MFADGVLCLVTRFLEIFVLTLLMFLYGKTVEADGQDAKAMVTGIVGVTRDELVLDDVLKELTAVEGFQVRTVLPQLLEEPTEDNVTSLLVGLLVE